MLDSRRMTNATTHDLFRRWLDDLWNGSPDAAKDLVSDDFVGHWPDRDIEGPEGLAEAVGQTRAMFPDITFELVVGPIVEGDLVAGRWIGRAVTPDGATGFVGNDILRVREGRFVEYWNATATLT